MFQRKGEKWILYVKSGKDINKQGLVNLKFGHIEKKEGQKKQRIPYLVN